MLGAGAVRRLRALIATTSFRLVLSAACLGVVVVLAITPVSNGLSRLATILAAGGALAWLIAALPRPRLAAVLTGGLLVLLVIACLVDRRPLDAARLEGLYLRDLRAAVDIPYVWGGEGGFGVDCSGLLRRARIRACLAYVLSTGRPHALASAADLWWHDASAHELAVGYGGRTTRLARITSLNDYAAAIAAGDIFVTANGAHVMAGLGPGEIVQSDPHRGRVCLDRLPAGDLWYRIPVDRVVWGVGSSPPAAPEP